VSGLLATCLDTIFASPIALGEHRDGRISGEVFVVDSASTDNTVAMVQHSYPQVRLLPRSENVGFSRGNNLALAQAAGRYLLLLNPDTEIVGDALVKMVSYLDAHPDVGLLGPRTLNSDGTAQSTRRRFPNLATGFFESTWLQPYAPKSLLDSYYYINGNDATDTLDVDWVQGSAIMARRELYEQIGGLDEGYVMYSEEMDWCRRAKDAGWRVVYLGDATIVHHGGKSSRQVVARSHILFQQSKLRYFRKYHGPAAALVLRVFLMLNYGVQLGIESSKYLLGHKRPLRRERVSAYWQVLKSGLKAN
jgi:N-acetylglucosaminyl-diphospho-decaprenol L-rhamnosyltransferase